MDANTITIGNVTITALDDSAGDEPPAKLSEEFPTIAAAQWAPFRARYPRSFPAPDRWEVTNNPWLVRSRGQTILVDAGNRPPPPGTTERQGPTLLDSLADHGVRPADIDLVFLTHLHYDHVGWVLTLAATPTFPRARYVTARADWEYFHRPEMVAEARTAFGFDTETRLTPLVTHGILDLIEGELALTDEVTAIPAPGHTPGHMCLRINSAQQRGMLLADLFHNPAEITDPTWNTLYEADNALATATRARLLELAAREEMIVAAYHMPKPGFGRIGREDGRLWWVSLDRNHQATA